MPQNPDDQIALFIRDEKTGRRAFNPKALKALGASIQQWRANEATHSKTQRNLVELSCL